MKPKRVRPLKINNETEWGALKKALAKLAEKETIKERLDREYCNRTKNFSQGNIRICGR
jgi:hypothetical protein